MPPRLPHLRAAGRALTLRTRPSVAIPVPVRIALPAQSRRGYAEKKNSDSGSGAEPATGPNQDVLGHVSEEAAAVGKVLGETQPDISQGTPVQEVSSFGFSLRTAVLRGGRRREYCRELHLGRMITDQRLGKQC